MTCYKNPNPFPTALYIIAAVMGAIFAYLIFTDNVGAADWHSQLKPPIATYQMAPGLTCWGHKEGSDIEHNIKVFKDNDASIEIIEDIRPFEGYDGMIQFLLTEEDGTQALKEWRWRKEDLLLCELLKQKLPKPNNS